MNARRYGLSFHHFAIAVRDYETAAKFLDGLGYCIGKPIFDPEQNVCVAWCGGADLPSIELVIASGADGPLQNLLKQQESVIYHSCYFSSDPETSLAGISADGLHVLTVVPPKPAVLFCGARVSFHYVSGFGLIEIIHAAEAPAIADQ
jgi:hypothetical protein